LANKKTPVRGREFFAVPPWLPAIAGHFVRCEKSYLSDLLSFNGESSDRVYSRIFTFSAGTSGTHSHGASTPDFQLWK